MSPHQSDGGDDVITVDMDGRFLNAVQEVVSPPEAPASISNAPRAYEAMETEQAMAVTPPQPPLRHLADEHVHVERSGSLKLTDFEVKGTLGLSDHSLLHGLSVDYKGP